MAVVNNMTLITRSELYSTVANWLQWVVFHRLCQEHMRSCLCTGAGGGGLWGL